MHKWVNFPFDRWLFFRLLIYINMLKKNNGDDDDGVSAFMRVYINFILRHLRMTWKDLWWCMNYKYIYIYIIWWGTLKTKILLLSVTKFLLMVQLFLAVVKILIGEKNPVVRLSFSLMWLISTSFSKRQCTIWRLAPGRNGIEIENLYYIIK